LPGLDHKVGSLNGKKRRHEFNQITRFNLIMAKKLIDTKAVISFDEQMRHTRKQYELRRMISRGKLRAEHYSMLGKTGRSYSNRSVMSSDTKAKDTMITSGRLSPHEQSLISRGSRRSSARRKTRNASLAQSQEYTSGNAFGARAHLKNISRPVNHGSIPHDQPDYAGMTDGTATQRPARGKFNKTGGFQGVSQNEKTSKLEQFRKSQPDMSSGKKRDRAARTGGDNF